MHVGYFSSHLGTQGGPTIVDKRVLEAISRYDRSNSYTVYGVTPESTRELELDNLSNKFRIKTLKPSGKWQVMSFGLALELMRHPVDLVHATMFAPLVIPCKFVFTVTCWSQYLQPEFYPFAKRLRLLFLIDRAIRKASGIFCYTEFLRNMVMERFNIDEERVLLLQPGIGEEMKPVEYRARLASFLKGFGIEGPYILFIGAMTKRKNVDGLVRAYHILRNETKIEHKLVLLGERIFLSEEIFRTVDELNLRDDIILVPRRPHSELPMFYSGADVFVFPTFSEGFGLPPLEAMACGTPVVASNTTCVPEVVGDAAKLVDPYSPEDIAAGMAEVLANDERRQDMIRAGMSRAAEFTWERAAVQAVSGYEKIYNVG
ncbi:MAG: glycosyltransferase family 4 protein [Planctomycetota bacterium]|jgi:glycosyltransferase involved in cell wall biosynthesis